MASLNNLEALELDKLLFLLPWEYAFAGRRSNLHPGTARRKAVFCSPPEITAMEKTKKIYQRSFWAIFVFWTLICSAAIA